MLLEESALMHVRTMIRLMVWFVLSTAYI